MTTVKAQRQTIDFLGSSIEVLLLPDNSFRIGMPQLVAIKGLGFSQDHAARDVKALLGKGLVLAKVSPINGTGRPMNAISIPEFERLIVALALKGNKTAIEWASASVGLTITELAHDAFGIKHAKEEREAWLKQRNLHKKSFHPKFTQWLKVDADGDSSKVNWSKEVKRLKAKAGVPVDVSVGEYSEEELDKLNQAEFRYDVLRGIGWSHEQALAATHS